MPEVIQLILKEKLSNQLIPQTEDQKLKKVLESIHSSFKVHLQQAMTLQKTVLTS